MIKSSSNLIVESLGYIGFFDITTQRINRRKFLLLTLFWTLVNYILFCLIFQINILDSAWVEKFAEVVKTEFSQGNYLIALKFMISLYITWIISFFNVLLAIKRLQDSNISGSWIIAIWPLTFLLSIGIGACLGFAFVALGIATKLLATSAMYVGMLVPLVFYLIPGTKGSNKYGADPRS